MSKNIKVKATRSKAEAVDVKVEEHQMDSYDVVEFLRNLDSSARRAVIKAAKSACRSDRWMAKAEKELENVQ